MTPIFLDSQPLALSQLRDVYQGPCHVSLGPERNTAIARSHAALADVLARGVTVYGINTGFGLLANKRISPGDLGKLQVNLIHSHAAGTGAPLPPEVVRLILLQKITSLSLGYSGVRPELIDRLLLFLNEDALPVIPGKGSVGASGDLAPLAHLAGTLLGIGDLRWKGQTLSATEFHEKKGLSPFALGPKEGLALINGTQVSNALALAALFETEKIFAAAMIAGAMSVDAARGSDAPFDPRISDVRPHSGQAECAAAYRQLMEGSEIRRSHLDCERVQDPYSLRCQPQVMGACVQQIRFAAETLLVEANSVTDNPLLFAEDGDVLSGGNFHAQPVAFAADNLALAIAEIGSLSERRIALLIDQHLSELPPFLVEEGGLNSGFMIPQVTAAALASENKSLAHPASVDSLPTSANQEDHVSMATFAARRLLEMSDNTATIVAIELLAAAQGIDFRRPVATSPRLQQAHRLIRERVPTYERDRWFAPDIEAIRQLVRSGECRSLSPLVLFHPTP